MNFWRFIKYRSAPFSKFIAPIIKISPMIGIPAKLVLNADPNRRRLTFNVIPVNTKINAIAYPTASPTNAA